MARIVLIAKILAVNLLVLFVFLFLIEGFFGYAYFGYLLAKKKPIAERAHTEYDEELGWVNLPSIRIDDMYGPGVYLATNAQRFRNQQEFGKEIPEGKLRIICSGDSFTLGYGVDNDHTWCQQLEALDERLQTINLGQGGYGVDQAFLWYRRNQDSLDHDIQVFAFITDDFRRMESETFLGYGKPFLSLRGDELYQENLPVASGSYSMPWVTTALGHVGQLRTVKALRSLAGQSAAAAPYAPNDENATHTRVVVSKIFEDLDQANQAKGSVLVLMYLPTSTDYMGTEATRFWQAVLSAEAAQKGYVFVDLVEALQSIPPAQRNIEDLFAGHYSDEGNAFVAEALLKALRADPRTSALLGE